MAKKTEPSTPPTHEEIAAQAFRIYQQEGCIPGRELDHWLRAEAELMAQKRNGISGVAPMEAPKLNNNLKKNRRSQAAVEP